jgi:uncharacterized protein YoaH (UPF0181 family)
MPATLELPEIAEASFRHAWGDELEQKMIEAMVTLGYRESKLSVGRISEILGLGSSIEAIVLVLQPLRILLHRLFLRPRFHGAGP